MKVLFITANRIGDAILSTGLLRHIVAAYPGARITVACGPLCTDLFAAVPGLDAVISMPKQSWNRHWWTLWRRCAPHYWDIVVDLRDSVVSRLLWRGKIYTYRPQSDTHKIRVNAAIMALDPPPARPSAAISSSRLVLRRSHPCNPPASAAMPINCANRYGARSGAASIRPGARSRSAAPS